MKHRHYSGRRGSARRQAVAISLALVALLLLCFIILQAGAKHYLKHWLLDNGADSVTIETLWFNPFSGMFVLNGVEITTAGNTVYSNDVFKINIGVPALFAKDALLEKANLADMKIEIRSFRQGGMRVGSYFFPPGNESEEPGASVFPPWTFKVKEASFKNIEIEYQGDISATLVIDEARVQDLDSGSKVETGSFSFSGKLNQAPIFFDLTKFYVDETVSMAGKLSLSHLDLDVFQGLMPAGGSLDGRASLNGIFSLEETTEGTLIQHFEGSVDLGNITAADGSWSAGGDLGWRGIIRSDQSEGMQLDGTLTARSPFFREKQSATAIELGKLTAEGKATVSVVGTSNFSGDLVLSLLDPEYNLGHSHGNAQSVSWKGTMALDAAADAAPARFSADGQVEAAGLDLSFSEKTGWQQEFISIDGDIELESGRSPAGVAGILFTGSTTLSNGILTLSRGDYHGAKLEHEGRITYRPGADVTRIGFDSTLSGQTVGGALDGKNLNWLLNEAMIEGDGTVFIGGGHFFSGQGGFDISGIEFLENETAIITLAFLKVDQFRGTDNGNIRVPRAAINTLRFLPSSFLPTELTAESLLLSELRSENFSSLSIDEAEAESLILPYLKKTPYSLIAESLLAKGIVSPSLDVYSLNHLSLHEATVYQGEGRKVIGGIEEMVITTMGAGADSVTADSIHVDSAHYRSPHEEREDGLTVSFASLESSRVAWSPGAIARIRKIAGSGLNASYIATENSDDNTGNQKDGESETDGKKSHSFPLVIETVILEGNNHILYTDPSLPETFTVAIDIDSFRAADIDLTDSRQPFSFDAEARVDKHSPLHLSGSASPLASPRMWEQELTLGGYPLANLSPFLIKSVGKRLISGKLELLSKMTLEGDQVDMENTLELKEIEMKTVNEETLRQFNTKLPIPLETALSFLRDGEGTITLQIPISGTLSSLDTSYTDIIVTALGNGISSAVKPMLAYTVLGPGGVLAYLGMKLGQDIISSDLPEITFQAGSTQLTPEHTQQLDSIGNTLENALKGGDALYYVYPKVLPGELAGTDDAALLSKNQRQKLYRLGEQRAENVRKYLVEHFAIEKEQLQVFQPGIIYDTGVEPTVTFMK